MCKEERTVNQETKVQEKKARVRQPWTAKRVGNLLLNNALIIITHNAKILEGLTVDYVHVLDDRKIVRTGDGRLVGEIIEEGFRALKEDEAK